MLIYASHELTFGLLNSDLLGVQKGVPDAYTHTLMKKIWMTSYAPLETKPCLGLGLYLFHILGCNVNGFPFCQFQMPILTKWRKVIAKMEIQKHMKYKACS